MVDRAADRPPLTRFRQGPLVRGLAAAALGAALEAGVSLGFGPGELEGAALAATVGVLIAVLAGAFGGLWAGLVVAAAGWTLQFFLVPGETWRDLIAIPVWLLAGALAGWLAERLRARTAEGRFLEDELTALREATRDAVIGLDSDGKIVGWSEGAATVYGHAAADALGRDFVEVTGEDDEGVATRRFLKALARSRRATETEVPHRRSDGTPAIVSLSGMSIARDDAYAGAVVVATDVTQLVGAKDEREQAEARYHSLTQQLPGATYVHPVGGRDTFAYVSPQVGTMLGYRAQDWMTETGLFFRLVHDEDCERVREEIRAAAESAMPLRSEYRMLGRDGTIVWVRDESTTVRGSDGQPLYVQGYLQDVTAEQEAGAERERLRADVRRAAADVTQRQLRLDLLSRASLALTGSLEQDRALRRASEIFIEGFAEWCVIDLADERGRATRAAVARGDADPLVGAPLAEPEPAVLEVIESGEPALSEGRICVPMIGRTRILGAVTLLNTDAGRPYGPDDLALAEHLGRLAALTVDNARLHEQVQEGADAAHVLTYVADGVFLVDRAGAIRLWNPTVEAITGFEADMVLGRQVVDVIPQWQTLAERIPVGGAEPVLPETVPIETDYGERWISISGVEFFGGTVYALRDLTESRRLEQLKAEFVATASHELRTPLAAVYGAAQTLRRHDFALDEAGRERFVSLIVEESERLGRIVNDILLANQLDIGSLELRSDVFDPNELVDRVLEAARAHSPSAIKLEKAAGPPPPPVASDPDRVRQVLVNLIENAIKYSPAGGRVEVGVAPSGRMVRFYVRDQGLGIPADEQGRIFDKFYRLDPNMSDGVGGIGLGLYICNELVRRMGGRIWVESGGETGSTFLFEIPASESSPTRPVLQEVLDTPGG
jgi:two-component system, OmpR family, phosphate regulon sensor histidine kinase PhoR